jgi:hypothetical protein
MRYVESGEWRSFLNFNGSAQLIDAATAGDSALSMSPVSDFLARPYAYDNNATLAPILDQILFIDDGEYSEWVRFAGVRNGQVGLVDPLQFTHASGTSVIAAPPIVSATCRVSDVRWVRVVVSTLATNPGNTGSTIPVVAIRASITTSSDEPDVP